MKDPKKHLKNYMAWENLKPEDRHEYENALNEIAHNFPTLSPMQLKVCALVKTLHPSWRIAQILCVSEKAIEHHRSEARARIGCSKGQTLLQALMDIKIEGEMGVQ